MNIIVLLLPLALLLALAFVTAFAWSAHRGQYDDLETPAHRLLLDDSVERNKR
jgi:cbb3-type cytochrome oxidase maturation protein